ncbi:two-component sensor histidine kinase [Kordiimonas sediminis]|uniref:histidine kinase n=1 Tax=Kordiimonas sediminis TaxID=1735581 RepID=A0A919APB6_9PROT|nr:PAS domain-containing sensor histidine kinase [Kordiimonas sediminis]GHF16678.1 two-component sensor histidine kinase [Kordiimonas sediminis]
MNWRVFFDVGAAYLVPAAIVAWVLVTFYALWRVGKITDRARSLESMTGFLEAMIRSDHRLPIWVWRSGAVQLGDSVMAVLSLQKRPEVLTDLFPGDEGIGGLPVTVVEDIEAELRGEKSTEGAIVAEIPGTDEKILIDHQHLIPLSDQWPVSVVWIEEAAGLGLAQLAAGTARASYRSMDYRLNELAAAIDGMPFPVWIRDKSLRLVNVNAAYVKAVDCKNAGMVVESETELFERRPLRAPMQALETDQAVRERQYAVVDGQRRAFNVTHVVVGKEDHVLGVAVDVTGEEEALSELARVLDSQSETLNRLRSPVAIFGPGKTLRFYNSAFSRLTHLSEDILSDEISHSELLELMREHRRLPEQVDFKTWKENVLRQYTALLEPFEEMWHLPDGTTHRVVTQPHPLGGLLILFEDVTDNLALERSYNTLVEVQRETLENMREGIAVFGSDSRLKLYNPAFVDIWRLHADMLKEEPHLGELIALIKEKPGQAREEGAQSFQGNLPVWMSERKSRTGSWVRDDARVIDFAIVPLPDGGMMLTQHDVTERYQVEQALRERSYALEAADRLKSEFITNMSYELRTPLNTIIGFGEMLDHKIGGPLTDKQSEQVGSILSAASELKDMISDVLDLAVIEAGEMDIDRVPVDLLSLMDAACAKMTDRAQVKSVVLEASAEDAPISVIGDPKRLRQVVVNMISIALAYAQVGSTLKVIADKREGWTALTVSVDTVSQSEHDRDRTIADIERGARLSGRRSAGLDLTLVKSITELHDGIFELTGFGDCGITISCLLPDVPKGT